MSRSGRLLLRLALDEHPHDVALLHDEILDAVDLDLRARPFAEQHPIADFHVYGYYFTTLVPASRANRNDFALLRLFFHGVGDNKAPGTLFLGVNALDDDTVVKRTKMHRCPPKTSVVRGGGGVNEWSARSGADISACSIRTRGISRIFSTL